MEHPKPGDTGLIAPTADTRAPADIGPSTHIIALLGIDEDDSDQYNNASPFLGDGWMVSDFYLWMHVLDGMGKSQKWITCLPPEYLVDKYCGEDKFTHVVEEDWDRIDERGKPAAMVKPIQTKWKHGFVHGDPFEDRVVVLDYETLPFARARTTIGPKGARLRETFLDELLGTLSEASAEGDPVIIMIFSHGDYDAQGGLCIGSFDNDALLTPQLLNESLSQHPDVGVRLFMTSCYSGHWVKTPAFKACHPTATGPGQESMGSVWSPSQRHAGGIFSAALLIDLLQEPITSHPRDTDPDELRTYQQMTRDIFNTFHRLCLPVSAPDYGTSPVFSEVIHDDEALWKRTGHELRGYEKNYDRLKQITPSDPRPKVDRKASDATDINGSDPRIIAWEWEKRHTDITDPSYPETTGGYGATRRGLSSRENILYMANRYIASRPGRPHDPYHRMCVTHLGLLMKNELPTDRRERLRRTLQYRLAVNDLANEYARILGVPNLVPIQEWRQPYVGEEQQIIAVVQDAGLFLRPSISGMDRFEWGGSYPKPDMYLARALAEAGYDTEGAATVLAKLKARVGDGEFLETRSQHFEDSVRKAKESLSNLRGASSRG